MTLRTTAALLGRRFTAAAATEDRQKSSSHAGDCSFRMAVKLQLKIAVLRHPSSLHGVALRRGRLPRSVPASLRFLIESITRSRLISCSICAIAAMSVNNIDPHGRCSVDVATAQVQRRVTPLPGCGVRRRRQVCSGWIARAQRRDEGDVARDQTQPGRVSQEHLRRLRNLTQQLESELADLERGAS